MDENGHLRLGYWLNNEAMKGKFIDNDFKKCRLSYDKPKNRPENEKNSQLQKWEKSVFNAFDNSLEMETSRLPNTYQLEDSHMLVFNVLYKAVDKVHTEVLGTVQLPSHLGVGPGVSFSQEMYKLTGVPQGLIACAHGSSTMLQWDPKLKELEGKSLYGAMLRRLVKKCNG